MQTLPTFTGSSTTGIAANLLNRRFLGIDMEEKFLQMSKARKEEIDTPGKRQEYVNRLEKQARLFQDKDMESRTLIMDRNYHFKNK